MSSRRLKTTWRIGDSSAAASNSHLIDPVTAFFSSHPLLFSPPTTLISKPRPHIMSDNLSRSLLSESVEADLPFFAPPPPESFEEEFEGLDLDSFDEDVQFPTLLEGPSYTYRDYSTLSRGSSSESTYSTDLRDDTTNSEYSSMTYSTSNYLSSFEIALRDIDLGSEYNDVDIEHNSVLSDSPMFLGPFGMPPNQLSPTLSQHVHMEEVHLDDEPPIGISPHRLSATAFQSPSLAVPTDPSVDVASATQFCTGPIRTRTICPHCGRSAYSLYIHFFRRYSMFLSSI